jgi:hypothetical protein
MMAIGVTLFVIGAVGFLALKAWDAALARRFSPRNASRQTDDLSRRRLLNEMEKARKAGRAS